MYPKIEIDHSKCLTPYDCKRCFQICPQAVFELQTMKWVRGKELDKKEPGAYRVLPFYRDKCTGCMDCVEVCPVGAIRVYYPEEVET